MCRDGGAGICFQSDENSEQKARLSEQKLKQTSICSTPEPPHNFLSSLFLFSGLTYEKNEGNVQGSKEHAYHHRYSDNCSHVLWEDGVPVDSKQVEGGAQEC